MTGWAGITRDTAKHRDVPVMSERVDLLYRMGRLYLFLPFSALCIVAVFYRHYASSWLAMIPLLLQIAVVVATREVAERYEQRDPADDPAIWARRYVWYSVASGCAWGLGAIIWFVPGEFSAEAFLALAFMGMTAAEFIARSSYRPAFAAQALCALSPLVLLLAFQANIYAELASLLVLFFGGVLYGYCDSITALLDESIRLRRDNEELVARVSTERDLAHRSRDVAEQAMRVKSAFIANISHEIRTPLNALLGMAQLLDHSDLDQRQKSHVRILLEAGRGLKILLDDVLTLTREDDAPADPDNENCDGAKAARTVGRMMQPRAWEKKIHFTVTAAGDLPQVAVDPRRVRQILLKLADNAVKFTEHGSVEIRVESIVSKSGKAMLRFCVSDTGLGIAPETAEHIFEPFTLGDISYSRRNQGAGLGLAVAKRMVEALGGEIGFHSAPGDGATFWFTVPAGVADQPIQPKTESVTIDAPPPSGLMFLLALSNRECADAVTTFLEPFGNRVVICESLSEAVLRSARENFTAIIAAAEDADMLASAPGARAPVLALMSGVAHRSDAAAAVLRWPASAGALYGALRDMLGRAADVGAAQPVQNELAAMIDASAFAGLEKSLGLPTLLEILHSYMKTAADLCEHLSAASHDEKWDDAARFAQDIAGAAGGLGLAALTQAARGFAQKARDGETSHEIRNAAQLVVGEHVRVCRALTNLYPDLAA